MRNDFDAGIQPVTNKQTKKIKLNNGSLQKVRVGKVKPEEKVGKRAGHGEIMKSQCALTVGRKRLQTLPWRC